MFQNTSAKWRQVINTGRYRYLVTKGSNALLIKSFKSLFQLPSIIFCYQDQDREKYRQQYNPDSRCMCVTLL